MWRVVVAVMLGVVFSSGAEAATPIPYVNPEQCQLPAGCVDINTVLIPSINAALGMTPPIVGTGTYADPRTYGDATTCNGAHDHDDAPAFRAALATGLPVMIPWPNCTWVTQVVCPGNGCKIFSFGSAGSYFNSGTSAPSLPPAPYIFVPAAAHGSATNDCLFDTKGFDGVQLEHFVMIGDSAFNGTVGICNSVGIANGAPGAFLSLLDVYISGMSNGIGTAMTPAVAGSPLGSGCDATGSLGSPVFQIRATNVTFDNDCTGAYGNLSDFRINDGIFANMKGPCLAPTAPGASATWQLNTIRCEYNYNFYGVKFGGAGIVMDGDNAGDQLANVVFDHTFGPAILFGDGTTYNGSLVNLSNIRITDSNVGAPTTSGCNIEFNAVIGIHAEGVQMTAFNTHPPYALCDISANASSYITWHETWRDGPTDTNGWNTAVMNGSFGSPLDIVFPGAFRLVTRPTSCSGLPSGSEWNNSGVVSVCP